MKYRKGGWFLSCKFTAWGATPIAPNIIRLSGLHAANYSVSHINQVPAFGDRQSE